jgi:hypothetical protein
VQASTIETPISRSSSINSMSALLAAARRVGARRFLSGRAELRSSSCITSEFLERIASSSGSLPHRSTAETFARALMRYLAMRSLPAAAA